MGTDASQQHSVPKPARWEWLALVGILLVAAVLRGGYLAEVVDKPDYAMPAVDAGFHDYWARGLATGNWTPPPGEQDPQIRETAFFRPPGYPYFLAAIHRVCGTSYLTPRVVQMCLGLLNVVLAFVIARRWYGRAVGLVFAGLMSGYWIFVYYEAEFHAPVLVISLLLGLVFTLGLWNDKPAIVRMLVAGVLLGLAALVRPNTLAFLPAVLAWVGWIAWRRRSGAQFATATIGAIVGTALAIAPATIRNYRVADDFVLISSNAGINLFLGNNAAAAGVVTDNIPGLGSFRNCYDHPRLIENLRRKLGRDLTASEVSRHFTGEALRFISENPGRFARLTLKKAVFFWLPREVSHNKILVCERGSSPVLRNVPGNFGLVIGLFCVGIITCLRDRKPRNDTDGQAIRLARMRWEISVLLLLLVGVYFLSLLPFFIAARYRVPIIPVLLLFGALGLTRIGRWAHTPRSRAAAVTAVAWIAMCWFAGRPATPVALELAKWHTDRGSAWLKQQQLDRACDEYRTALRHNPRELRAGMNLGVVLTRQKQAEEAITHYRAMNRIQPNVAALHFNLAMVLEQQGRLDEAIREYRSGLLINPDNAGAQQRLRAALSRQGVPGQP